MTKKVSLKDISLSKPFNKIGLKSKIKNVTLVDLNLENKKLNDFKAKYKILSTFPSIDTGVCDSQTKKMVELFSNKEEFVLLNVSADLPFALKRWCLANEKDANVHTLSDYKGLELAQSLGILIKEYNLLYRSVFILNSKNEIIYFQLAKKVSEPINFENVASFVDTLG